MDRSSSVQAVQSFLQAKRLYVVRALGAPTVPNRFAFIEHSKEGATGPQSGCYACNARRPMRWMCEAAQRRHRFAHDAIFVQGSKSREDAGIAEQLEAGRDGSIPGTPICGRL